MRTGLGVNKRGVAFSAGSFDLDLVCDTPMPCCPSLSRRSGKACGYRDYEVAPCDIAGLGIIFLLVFLIFRHGCSFPKRYHFLKGIAIRVGNRLKRLSNARQFRLPGGFRRRFYSELPIPKSIVEWSLLGVAPFALAHAPLEETALHWVA